MVLLCVIPPFDAATGNLPPGIHLATWEEIVARYGYTPHRLILLAGLKRALDVLRGAGCQRVYLDGSFVGATNAPNDFDACWEPAGVDPLRLEPALLDLRPPRSEQKAHYGGELFPSGARLDALGTRALEFFQRDRQSGDAKGIIAIDLGGLP